jgi:hypothetical protein
VSDESREPSVEDQWAAFMSEPSDDFKRHLSSVPWRGLILVLLIVAVIAGLFVVMFSTGLHKFWEPPPSAGGPGPRDPRSVDLPVSAIPRAAIPAAETPEATVPAATHATVPAVVEPPVAVLPERVANRPEPEPQQPLLPIELPERRPSVSERGPAARAPVPKEPAHTAPAPDRPAQVAASSSPAGESSPEDSPRRMAEFLVRSLGREAATEHSRRAAALYGPSHAQGVYWSTVLGHVQKFSE